MHSHYGVETNKTLLFIRHSVAFHCISIRLDGPNDTIDLVMDWVKMTVPKLRVASLEKEKWKRDAACEDRTHDLGIMRPALFQLSQSRFNSALSPSLLYTQSSCLYERTYPILFFYVFLIATHCILSLGVC